MSNALETKLMATGIRRGRAEGVDAATRMSAEAAEYIRQIVSGFGVRDSGFGLADH
jgi:hypothetical protein